MSVLIDTNVLTEYLLGVPRAARIIDAHPHRAISVITWLEIMASSPPERTEPTRAFLRSFERLSINEAIADEALRLLETHPQLDLHRVLNWGTARMNRLLFVTADATHFGSDDQGVATP